MSNAVMICNVPSGLDEEKQTEEMLAELNRQTRLNRNDAKRMSLDRERAVARYVRERENKLKWDDVKQVAFCTLCTAALYGFEQIGLPHSISLLGMLFLASYAMAIAATVVSREVRRIRFARMKRKGNRR